MRTTLLAFVFLPLPLFGQFGPVRILASETISANHVLVGNVNGDAFTDIMLLNGTQLVAKLNEGHASFADRHVAYDDLLLSRALLVDVNGDGLDDLLNYSEDQFMLLYMNDPLLGYTDSVVVDDYSSNAFAQLLAVDLDQDGDMDLLTASGPSIQYYLNDGAGNFSQAEGVTSSLVDAFAVADIDGDADLDLVWSEGGVRWSANDGALAFLPIAGTILGTIGAAADPWVACGDIDVDGDIDILSGVDDKRGVVLNQGGGTFAPLDLTTGLPHCYRAQLHDMDGDADPDLLGYDNLNLEISAFWWENDGTGDFATIHVIDTVQTIPWLDDKLHGADMDNDGDVDVVSREHVYLNDGSGALTKHTFDIPSTGLLAVSDQNLDGQREIYWSKEGLIGLVNNGSLDFFPAQCHDEVPIEEGLRGFHDMDGDGVNDVLYDGLDSVSNSRVIWRRGLAGGTYGPEHVLTFPWVGDVNALMAGDLNNDGSTDLLASSPVERRILLNQGGGVFGQGTGTPLILQHVPPMDINGDGTADFWCRVGQNAVAYYFDGVATLTQGPVFATSGSSGRFGDLSGDGVPDFLVHVAWSDEWIWYTNVNGTFLPGQFSVITAAPPGDEPMIVDVEGDGDLDVVLIKEGWDSCSVVLFHNLGGGTFGPAMTVWSDAFTEVHQVLFEDLDGDTDLDLLIMGSVAGSSFGSEILLLESFAAPNTVADMGSPRSIMVAPNPFSEHSVLSTPIELPPAVSVEVVDMKGRTILFLAGNGTRNIPLDRGPLMGGMYVARAFTEDGPIGAVRFVVQF